MKRPLLVISYIACSMVIHATDISFNLTWKEEKKIQTLQGNYITIPSFDGATHLSEQQYLPFLQINHPIQASSFQAELIDPLFLPLSIELSQTIRLPQDISIETTTGWHKGSPVAIITCIPLRRNVLTGKVEKLVSGKIRITMRANQDKVGSREKKAAAFTSESVLSAGTFYKIAVSQEGIYKIDEALLTQLGINPTTIDPRNIRIYGNGGAMLPEENADFRPDDLLENAIYVIGEGDGRFDPGDYVLFYGQSPHRWRYNPTGQTFFHQFNIYSDETYYFLTVDKGPGKRIGNYSHPSVSPNVVTTFPDFAFHETDTKNFLQSGRRWFGEQTNFAQTEHSFNFSFPDLVTSIPVFAKVRVAAAGTSSNSFQLSLNGQAVFQVTAPPTSPTTYAPVFTYGEEQGSIPLSTGNITARWRHNNASYAQEGWLDFIELNAYRNLNISGNQPLFFRNSSFLNDPNGVQFSISGANAATEIWEITNQESVRKINTLLSGTNLSFSAPADLIREYVAFNPTTSAFLAPSIIGRINNQNLHGIGQPDMIIITHSTISSEAYRLAAHRQAKGLEVEVVDMDQIYNEFASGRKDISAIRDFMKMLYDRAAANQDDLPQYLLLFGDASYDYKDRISSNTNIVPTYQSENSDAPVSTFCTDDYFGLLDDTEGGNINESGELLDIAVGRIPVSTLQQAKIAVDKIFKYEQTASFGSWRNYVAFVADDEDGNIHIDDADDILEDVAAAHPSYNFDKIYFDIFPQVSSSGGARYPDVNEAINRRMFSGALIVNYVGHGGVNGWGHERVLDAVDINSWENEFAMPLFLTATCELSKFDDPAIFTAGEQIFLKENGGAISMVTTTRIVTSSANEQLNRAFMTRVFEPYPDGAITRFPTQGEVMVLTKNTVPKQSNNRKFMLLGDPAMTLSYPQMKVKTKLINAKPVGSQIDTLNALELVTIEGEVTDQTGNFLSDFSGTVYPTVFDKKQAVSTLANDPGSYKTNINIQKTVLFNGRSSVQAGRFSFSFVVPRDINYSIDAGKISYYAEDRISGTDAAGYETGFKIGGTASSFADDEQSPEVKVFMNNDQFVFGGITDEDPLLFVKLFDDFGINTAGNGVGHDITAVLDEDTRNTYVLNDYYQAELNSYKGGEVKFPLQDISSGRHTMKVKAWDVYNNPAEGYTEFVVASSASLALEHVLNYPNPFTTRTNFMFEHNRPGEPMLVQIKIFSVSGKLVKTISKEIVSEGYRVSDIEWDGLDEYGDKIGRGVYVYKLSVSTSDRKSADEYEKLVILR